VPDTSTPRPDAGAPAGLRPRTVLVLALAALLAVAALVAVERSGEGRPVADDLADGRPLPAGAPNVIWRADGETSLVEEWASYSTADRCSVVTSPERPSALFTRVSRPRAQGAFAYRSVARDDDICYEGERAEIAQGNPHKPALGDRLFHEGDERWISWQVRLGRGFPIDVSTWQLLMQLKQIGGFGPPALGLEVREGHWVLFNSSNSGRRTTGGELWSSRSRAMRGLWVRLTLRVRFSPDPRRGFVELFGDLRDGAGYQRLLRRTATATMKIDPRTRETIDSHTRLGIYRDPRIEGRAEAWFDGYTVARTRAAAEGNAF